MISTNAALQYHGFNASLIYPASNKRGHLRSQNINSSQIPASDWIRSFDSGGIWTIPARYIWLRSFLRSSFSATADSASFLSWMFLLYLRKCVVPCSKGYLFICSLSFGSRFPHSYVVLFTLEQIIGKYFSIGFDSLYVAEYEILGNQFLGSEKSNKSQWWVAKY